jgi:hypothetical protein
MAWPQPVSHMSDQVKHDRCAPRICQHPTFHALMKQSTRTRWKYKLKNAHSGGGLLLQAVQTKSARSHNVIRPGGTNTTAANTNADTRKLHSLSVRRTANACQYNTMQSLSIYCNAIALQTLLVRCCCVNYSAVDQPEALHAYTHNVILR